MIGKRASRRQCEGISIQRQIADLVSYIDRAGRDQNPGEVVARGALAFVSQSRDAQIAEMAATAMGAPRTRSPVVHLILSWRDGEQPSVRQIDEAIGMLLDEIGLAGHQALWSRHRAANDHLHVIACRVAPDASRSTRVEFMHNAIGRAVARIEHAQGWQREPGARFEVIGDTVARSGHARTATGYDRDCSLRGNGGTSANHGNPGGAQSGHGLGGSDRGDHRHTSSNGHKARRDLIAAGADTAAARVGRLVAETLLRSAYRALPCGAVVAQRLEPGDTLSTAAAAVRYAKAS